jgi:hypothetical protein
VLLDGNVRCFSMSIAGTDIYRHPDNRTLPCRLTNSHRKDVSK